MMKLIAKGNTAEVFDYAKGMVCKLFYLGYPVESVKKEFQNAKLLYDLKLPVPKCYEQVYINNRHGLVYEKLEGTDLLNNLKGTDLIKHLMDQNKYDFVLSILANTHKEWLHHECKLLPSYKDFIRSILRDTHKDLLSNLDDLPDGNALCHGDFHPANIMIDKDGKVKVIDFMNLCRGPREYDIARTFYLVGYSKPPREMKENETFLKTRERLAKDYLEEMGVDIQDIKPYIFLIEKCHMIETSR